MSRDALFSKIVDAAAEAYSDDFFDEFVHNELPWNKVSYRFVYIPYGSGHIAVTGYQFPMSKNWLFKFSGWARR